jgi:hypothetical protein
MGPEPYLQAMTGHPDFDIIIGGRAYDPAPYVAFCAFQVFKQSYKPVLSLDKQVLGGFTHMGKIMECGGVCALPKSPSSMATIYLDGTFDIRPLQPGCACTPVSVAAHTLYEKTRPDQLHGPGGYIDLTKATYQPLVDNISVRVRGARFNASVDDGERYTVKLEGSRVVGYRTIFMGSFADPILISQLPSLLDTVKDYVTKQHKDILETWDLGFHVYGRDQMLNNAIAGGPSAPSVGEVFLIGEALAETQAVATSIATTAKTACIHGPYKGQKATSGNFGFGLGGKSEIETGLCAEFSIYHLMDLDEGEEDAVEIQSHNDRRHIQSKKIFHFEVSCLGSGDRIDHRLSTEISNPSDIIVQPELAIGTDEAIFGKPLTIPCTLGEAAKIIRSKNAGPYEVTLDVMFDDKQVYHQIKSSGILQPELIADMYGLQPKDIIYSGFFDQALAFKVTIPRLRDGKPKASGGFMESDVHGSQKHIPLMNLKLDLLPN